MSLKLMHKILILISLGLVLSVSSIALAGYLPLAASALTQFSRANTQSLDGAWEFTFDHQVINQDQIKVGENVGIEQKWYLPESQVFDHVIQVPNPYESELSGINRPNTIHTAVWYRKKLDLTDQINPQESYLLRFAAIDYHAHIWVNGELAGEHVGGYTPIEINIAPFLRPGIQNTIVVRAYDDVTDPLQRKGKQRSKIFAIFYQHITGIWQPVTLSQSGPQYIKDVQVTWLGDRHELEFIPTLSSLQTANHFRVRVFEQEPDGTIGKLVALKDLNLKDDSKELRIRIQNPKLWYPKDSFHPEWRQNLYHLTYELLDEKSLLIDQVQSYTGLRTIKQNNGQLFINDELVHLRGVLNQLYRGDTLFTGNEETIKKEIRDTLALGFNFARFHQSVDKRAMEAADRMGLLFSAEAPSPEDITEQSVEQALQEVRELVILARNHPGLVQIDDINESWGLSLDPRQGQLKELMKTDPIAAKKLFDFGLNYMKRSTSLIFSLIKSGDSRFPSNQLSPEGNSHGVIVPSNDGWDESGSSGNADGGHFYAHDGQGIIENYKNLPQHISPGSSLPNPDASGNPVNQLKHQFVPGASSRGEPFYLSEMGGVGFVEGRIPPNTWGYGGIEKTKRAFALRIHSLFAGLSHIKVAGFTYTQLKDCGYEVNGLLTQFGLPILPKKLIREIVLMGYYPNRDKRIAKVYDDINRYFDEQVKLRFLNANVCKDLFL